MKEKEISEDEERAGEDQIQKLTNQYIAEIESILAGKEKDLMQGTLFDPRDPRNVFIMMDPRN